MTASTFVRVRCDTPGCPNTIQDAGHRASPLRKSAAKTGWRYVPSNDPQRPGRDYCPDHDPRKVSRADVG